MELNERSRKNLKGVHPDLVRVLETAIIDSPIGFTIVEGIRSTKRQQELYAQGFSKADGVKVKSNHQIKVDGYGHAVDLYANPINVKDTRNIAIVADHIKRTSKKLGISVEWGGDWKMRDYPHFELKS